MNSHEEKMEVKSEQQTENLCFTCLSQSEEFMQISAEASDSDSVTVVEVLTKHFWFQRDEFTKAHVICENCWTRLDDFHQFYQEVEENHRCLKQKLPEAGELTKNSSVMVQIHTEIEVKEDDIRRRLEDVESEQECSTAAESGEKHSKTPEKRILPKRKPQPRKSDRKVKQMQQFVNKENTEWDETDQIIHTHVQYDCSICEEKNFKIFNHLKVHMIKAHNTQGCISCCGKRYYKRLILLEHVLKLKDPNRFKCDVCGKILCNSSAIRRHKREKHATIKEKKYRCDRCPQRFVRASLLESHLKQHKNLEEGSIKCPYCQKIFDSFSRMNTHIRHRHESRQYACDECEKEFPTDLLLQRHKEEHSSPEELKVQCDICHQWLKNKNSLTQHSRRHTGPMKCNICGHVAPHEQALSRHRRVRHKVKLQFDCKTCATRFRTDKELKEHAQVHRRTKKKK